MFGRSQALLEADSFTPEEVNDLFQDKDADIVHVQKVELAAQGISVPYLDSNTLRSPNWDFSGNMIVRGNDFIRLTSDKQHQVGNMFARMPVQAESFEMELTFHIHSAGSSGLSADGLAIWFIDAPSPIGDVFGAKNNFNGLAIFVDTYKNGKQGHFPYISAMLGDGKTRYDKWTDGMNTKLAGCTAKSVMNPALGSTRMRIVHLKDGYLSVDLNYNPQNTNDWHNCFTLSDVKLPVVKYLGLTAESGELTENVDIIGNKLYALYQPQSSVFIESFGQLQQLMEQQEQQEKQINKNGRISTNPSRIRKSITRLRNAEKRLKERERKQRLETYGDEEATFVRRWFIRMLLAVKYGMYFLFAVLVVWVAFIVYRVQKQKKRSKTTGLLD